MMTKFKLGNRSLERVIGVNPLLVECVERALLVSEFDMTIPWMGGVRKAEEQNALYLQGNSKADGYKKLSYHQSGNAIDVIPVLGGYGNKEGFKHFSKCMFSEWAKMNTGKRLTWGGNWKTFLDMPHYEIK
jgi:peptidoglycan LD-endopeptidase CwlK